MRLRNMTERESLARDLFLQMAATGNGRTPEHNAQQAMDLADKFFDVVESRRPNQQQQRKPIKAA